MTTTIQQLTLTKALDGFMRSLEAKNRSGATSSAYCTDLRQFFAWLAQERPDINEPRQVFKMHVTEYLATLNQRGLSGISRARKLAAIREFFRYLVDHELIERSPAQGIETPRMERRTRTVLAVDEYSRMLAQAGDNPRDYAILQLFLQTGIRVSELCNVRITDIDFTGRGLTVRGKGRVERTIDLERRAVQALRNYLTVRPDVLHDHLFVNQYDQPLGIRGVKKLVLKYRRLAGIQKRAGCHSFRHTFASFKANRGVSPYRLKEWLGHARLDTTMIYVHLERQNGKREMEATSL